MACLEAVVPHGPGAPRPSSPGGRLVVLDGPMTGTTFLAYDKQRLAPAPGDAVVLDNLATRSVENI